jgi:multiple sugar transport system ATP-binding protein
MDVYAEPANLFVAGFIGTPAMNMIAAEVASDGPSGPRIVAEGMSLPIDRRDPTTMMPGQKIVFGIRPEDISLVPAGLDVPASVEAPVVTVEPLGAEYLLCFTVGAHELMAKIAGRSLPRVGERLRFAFNMAHAHAFDAASGQSLRPAHQRGRCR